MSGEEFLQWRNSSEFRTLPVAILTGSMSEIVRNRLTALGAVMVLPKGYSIADFVQSIQTLSTMERFVPAFQSSLVK